MNAGSGEGRATARPSLSGLTPKQIVTQSAWCHPEWDAETHAQYLTAEEDVDLEAVGQSREPGETSPLDTIDRWRRAALTKGAPV